jgi:hypothetical protein
MFSDFVQDVEFVELFPHHIPGECSCNVGGACTFIHCTHPIADLALNNNRTETKPINLLCMTE